MSDNFVIDLTGCKTAGEIISNISIALELPEVMNKNITLNLKDFQLNQSQILSIKSLISSCGSNLEVIKTSSLITKQLCEDLGIKTGDSYVEHSHEFSGQYNSSQPFEQENFEQSLDVDDNIEETPQEYKEETPQEFKEEWHNEVQTSETVEEKPQEVKSETTTNDDLFREIYNDETALNSFGNFAATLNADNEPIEEEKQNSEESNQNRNEAEQNLDDVEKKVISVYTKADEEETQETYEEVDFYAPKSDEPVIADSHNTMYVTQTLRNGQTVDYDGNVVIIGDCHPGSEIRATGDITVWGVLGSIAHAGIKGDIDAKIRALKINAVQLRIADCYSRRPDGSNIPYIVKSSTFTPEEARVVDGNIVLYKLV